LRLIFNSLKSLLSLIPYFFQLTILELFLDEPAIYLLYFDSIHVKHDTCTHP
jgi:hypothetical protein